MTLRFALWPSAVFLSTLGFILVHSEYLSVIYTTIQDKSLYGYAFRNLTMITVVECGMLCQRERSCMAFQMCGGDAKCQLLSSNSFQTPSALVTTKGCTYYSVKNSTCLPGYAGDLCQDVVKSCRGYKNGTRRAGRYKVFDDKMKLYEVFCDFDSNSSTAWTLIQSYQRQRVSDFCEAFIADSPINDDSPRWDAYRLPLDRMQSIQSDSSKFRFTCKYDTDGVVYRDYLEGTKTQVDILHFKSQSAPYCYRVEYVNIRGHNCTKCTMLLFQKNGAYPFHSDSGPSNLQNYGCEFQPSGGRRCPSHGEDNFGAYRCINEKHRCTSSPTATTQAWLGGN